MRCPRCEFESPSDEECLKCGIVFMKWLKIQEEELEFDDDDELVDETEPKSHTDATSAPKERLRLPIPANKRELVNVFRSLGHLLLTGISPIEAFRMLIPTLSKRFATATEDILNDLMDGKLLSASLEKHPVFFDARLIAELRGAERTGHFGECFQNAAERIEAQRAFKKELLRKQWGLIITLILSILILPIPSLVFGGRASYLAQVTWPLGTLIGGYFLIPILVQFLIRRTFVGDALKKVAWASPWPGTLYVTWIRSHFLDDLSLHLNTGHSMSQSLDSVLNMSEDPVLTREITASLERGDLNTSLSSVLIAGRTIAQVDAIQVATGEKTGTLVNSLAAIAVMYRERFQRGLQSLLRVLQIIIVLAAFGFIGWKTIQSYKEAKKRVDGVHKILENEMQRLYRGPLDEHSLPGIDLERLQDNRLPEGYQQLSP